MDSKAEHEHVSQADTSLVLETLEHDQLVSAKREPVPRRRLKGGELALVWALAAVPGLHAGSGVLAGVDRGALRAGYRVKGTGYGLQVAETGLGLVRGAGLR
jgi:hypothetical protein